MSSLNTLLIFCFLRIIPIYEGFLLLNFAKEGDQTCMSDLGCFNMTKDFFNDQYRIINVLPQSRDVINTKFFLYTRNNTINGKLLVANNKTTLTSSHLDASNPTIFIVHGFIDSENVWMTEMKDEFLKKGHYNAIIVNWDGGDNFPYYQATANTRVVGAEIAYLASKLKEEVKIMAKDCHIIGHSLGAQIAGYAGERMPNLGRITALDPAGPNFVHMPPSVRIDPTDAQFVDVIHTDSNTFSPFGFGMMQSVGHVDFYPNGGVTQPGCATDFITRELLGALIFHGEEASRAVPKILICEHERAVHLFKSSINLNGCMFVGFRCPDWDEYKEEKCSSCGPEGKDCAVMGLDADKYKPDLSQSNNRFFLETSGSQPFCVNRYEVILKLGSTKVNSISGEFELSFKDQNGQRVTVMEGILHNTQLGKTLTYFITSPFDVLSQETIDFYWRSSEIIKFSTYKIDVENIKVILDTISTKIEPEKYPLTYFPTIEGLLEEGKFIQMTAGK